MNERDDWGDDDGWGEMKEQRTIAAEYRKINRMALMYEVRLYIHIEYTTSHTRN